MTSSWYVMSQSFGSWTHHDMLDDFYFGSQVGCRLRCVEDGLCIQTWKLKWSQDTCPRQDWRGDDRLHECVPFGMTKKSLMHMVLASYSPSRKPLAKNRRWGCLPTKNTLKEKKNENSVPQNIYILIFSNHMWLFFFKYKKSPVILKS